MALLKCQRLWPWRAHVVRQANQSPTALIARRVLRWNDSERDCWIEPAPKSCGSEWLGWAPRSYARWNVGVLGAGEGCSCAERVPNVGRFGASPFRDGA